MLSVSMALFVADNDQVLDSHIHPRCTRSESQERDHAWQWNQWNGFLLHSIAKHTRVSFSIRRRVEFSKSECIEIYIYTFSDPPSLSC